MAVEVIPSVGEAVASAIERALTTEPSDSSGASAYRSAWRLAGLGEAVGGPDEQNEGYAPSPRSTRGATRA